jgi:hypothetical protein
MVMKAPISITLLCLLTVVLASCGKLWGGLTLGAPTTCSPSAFTLSQFGQSLETTQGFSLVLDPSGDVYAVGNTNGTLGTQYGTHGNQDAFISQFSSGALGFTSQQGAVGTGTGGSGVVRDSSGNFYVSGDSQGVLGTQYGTHGIIDTYVSKFSSAGVLNWTSQIGEAGDATFGDNIAMFGSNLYEVGYTNGVIGAQYGVHGTQDSFVTQVSTSGVFNWTSQLGAAGQTSEGNRVTTDSLGNVYVVGFTSGTLGAQYGTHGTDDAFVSQFSSTGTLNWTSQLGAAGTITEGEDIVIDTSGNIYIVGYSAGVVGTQYGTHGTNDIFIAQFSSSGVLNWASQLGAAGQNTLGYSLILDSSNNIYSIGRTSAILGTQYGTHGTLDFFMSSFSSSGVLKWSSQLGVAGSNTQGEKIVSDGCGDFFIAGFTAGYLGGIQYGTHGVDDVFITRADSNGGLH